jgi:hypothetical protein
MTVGNEQQRMQTEAASLALYDGSRNEDIRERTAAYLRDQGVNITQVADSEQAYTNTTLVDHTGNPYVLQYLLELMNISPYRIFLEYDPSAEADVEIYLGKDWANKNTLP